MNSTENSSESSLDEANTISYRDYYRKNYNVIIQDTRQPLLKVVGKTMKRLDKNKEFKEETEYIYLIPELVSLTGLTDAQHSSKDTLRDIAPFTKLTPKQRI